MRSAYSQRLARCCGLDLEVLFAQHERCSHECTDARHEANQAWRLERVLSAALRSDHLGRSDYDRLAAPVGLPSHRIFKTDLLARLGRFRAETASAQCELLEPLPVCCIRAARDSPKFGMPGSRDWASLACGAHQLLLIDEALTFLTSAIC